MLVVRDILEVAADFAWVGIAFEGVGLAGFEEGAWVGVEPKFMEEDETEEGEGSGEIDVSSEILGDEAFVDGWECGEGRPVSNHLFELAIIRDIHWLIIIKIYQVIIAA